MLGIVLVGDRFTGFSDFCSFLVKGLAHQASLLEHSFDHVGALLSTVEVLQAILGQLLDQVVLYRLLLVHEVAFVALGLDELDSNELQLLIQFQNSIL